MLQRIRKWLPGSISEDEFVRERNRILSNAPVPEFWLFGKAGSGKTSLIKYLTGVERAQIGEGFRPQTKQSEQFEFPSPESPLIRFLDTRGLGETHYDPTEDIRAFEASAHVVIVTVRVMDHALEEIVEPLKEIRASSRTRPILLALTCLHEAYPGQQHPAEDPFENELLPTGISADLHRSIALHQQRFDGLVDAIVPLDLTRPEEAFDLPEFGGERLKSTLLNMLPAVYRHTLLTLDDAMKSLADLNERRAMPYIISYSMMAASAGAVPLPWVDIPFVMAIQSHLVYQLADIYGRRLDANTLLKMSAAIGARLLTRLLLRGALKLVPYVGIAANAALAYAYTHGMGMACCWYFGQVCQGNAPSKDELEHVWEEQLVRAAESWKSRRSGDRQ